MCVYMWVFLYLKIDKKISGRIKTSMVTVVTLRGIILLLLNVISLAHSIVIVT